MSAEDDDFERRAGRLDARGRRALLDDLESIRTLLAESGDEAARADPGADAVADAIPVLREVVQPSPAGHRAPPVPPAGARPSPGSGADEQQGDLFDPRTFADRLLDADWAEERERILADARAGLDAFSLGLDEDDRREREARLREAVARRLAPRMEQLLGEAVDELRDNMLRVIRRELDALLIDIFSPPERAGDEHQD